MITKYRLKIKAKNLYNKILEDETICDTESDVNEKIKLFYYRLKIYSPKKGLSSKTKKVNKQGEKLYNENKKNYYVNFKKVIEFDDIKIEIRVNKKEYSTELENGFVESFHTSLRKHCNGAGANGLWHWINLCSEDKKYGSLVRFFWGLMSASFNQAKEKHEDLFNEDISSEDLKKLSNIILKTFINNMEVFYKYGERHSGNIPMEEARMYNILISLMELLKREDDFQQPVYSVISL